MDGEQERARAWFEALRDRLCTALEAIEDEADNPQLGHLPPGRFAREAWDREGGGGGTMALMRGRVFEKVGVNISTVWGEIAPEYRQAVLGAGVDPRFWASGISVVAHPRSPHVPPAHMNTRHLRTTRQWFGGGADLNPIYPDPTETAAFHARLEHACHGYAADAYPRFKDWADRYFHLPHRGEARGVGGIFFDHIEDGFTTGLDLVQSVGEAFLDIYPRLVRAKAGRPWSEEERQHQLVRRGRYVEFNLLYDRGTQFGLKTGGHTEAILMSLPPAVAWP